MQLREVSASMVTTSGAETTLSVLRALLPHPCNDKHQCSPSCHSGVVIAKPGALPEPSGLGLGSCFEEQVVTAGNCY